MVKIKEEYIDPSKIQGKGFTPFDLRTKNKSMCYGSYLHEENYINIFGVWSKAKGDMKEFIEYLVNPFP